MREMEAENEHVKNMLIGLNEKLTVFNDLKVDVENHKAMLKNSEGERDNLQIHIKETSKKVIIDSEQHSSYE